MEVNAHEPFSETTPLKDGSYKVTFFRNEEGACAKEEATAAIIHFHNCGGTLVRCEYTKLNH